MKLLPPGSTIGIIGGGQLGRMTAMAAARLGYKCHVFCTSIDDPATEVCEQQTISKFDDQKALIAFAQSVDVATTEWENVPVSALDIIAQHTQLYPSAQAFRIAQNRKYEKDFARKIGVGTADFNIVKSAEELKDALPALMGQAVLKSTRMGYDGKGQTLVNAHSNADDVWMNLGTDECILEAFVEFEKEVSVIVAVGANGETSCYPVAENIHKNGILFETTVPANISIDAQKAAEDAALLLAKNMGIVGLLVVEFFALKEPDKHGNIVLMNELAPRPHNSGHWTMDACHISQFEQLIRAICGLPLGNATPHSKAMMHNLIGDEANDWPNILKQPNCCLHLYGKKECRAGRKMGHYTKLLGSWS